MEKDLVPGSCPKFFFSSSFFCFFFFFKRFLSMIEPMISVSSHASELYLVYLKNYYRVDPTAFLSEWNRLWFLLFVWVVCLFFFACLLPVFVFGC